MTQQKTILIVDDTHANLVLLGQLLQPNYRVRVANSGLRALQVATTLPRPDLILLDVMMPGMDGYSVMHELKANPNTQDIPVIFVTAMNAEHDEEYGLEQGAVDYITKPIRALPLLARIKAHLALKNAQDLLRNQNHQLEEEISQRTHELELVKDVSLHALAMIAEKRDNETGNHLQRARCYVETLMQQLQHHPRFEALLSPKQQRMIAKAAPLHDIGKVGIPDPILLKPGRLTVEEFENMKLHVQIGADAIDNAIRRVIRDTDDDSKLDQDALQFLQVAHQIVLYHHEKWDGSGYPQGLSGENIPFPARLMAIADVFDALTHRRHYKEAYSFEKAHEIMMAGRGKHFDPEIFDAYLACQKEFERIANEYADPV